MLQSKGLSSRATEEDHERTRQLADAEMTIHQLEGLLEQKDKEMLQLREVRLCVCACVTGKREKKRCSQAFSYVGVCVLLCTARSECVKIKPFHIQAKPLAASTHDSKFSFNKTQKLQHAHTRTKTQEGTLYPILASLSCSLCPFSNISLGCCKAPPSGNMLLINNK